MDTIAKVELIFDRNSTSTTQPRGMVAREIFEFSALESNIVSVMSATISVNHNK